MPHHVKKIEEKEVFYMNGILYRWIKVDNGIILQCVDGLNTEKWSVITRQNVSIETILDIKKGN